MAYRVMLHLGVPHKANTLPYIRQIDRVSTLSRNDNSTSIPYMSLYVAYLNDQIGVNARTSIVPRIRS